MNHREVWKPKEKDSKNEGWTFPWIRFIEPVKERQAWRHANIYTRPPQLSGLLWNVPPPPPPPPPPPNKKKKEGKHFFLLVHLNLRNTLRKYPALEPFYNAFDHRKLPPKLTDMGSRRRTGQICPICSSNSGFQQGGMTTICPSQFDRHLPLGMFGV